jgi:hypothetical protein
MNSISKILINSYVSVIKSWQTKIIGVKRKFNALVFIACNMIFFLICYDGPKNKYKKQEALQQKIK